ncbi:hypothetical protein D3C73_779580 [compost metagenome]
MNENWVRLEFRQQVEPFLPHLQAFLVRSGGLLQHPESLCLIRGRVHGLRIAEHGRFEVFEGSQQHVRTGFLFIRLGKGYGRLQPFPALPDLLRRDQLYIVRSE